MSDKSKEKIDLKNVSGPKCFMVAEDEEAAINTHICGTSLSCIIFEVEIELTLLLS